MSGSIGIRAILIPLLYSELLKDIQNVNNPPFGGLIQENRTQSPLSFSCNQSLPTNLGVKKKNHLACKADVPAVSTVSG